MHPAVVQGMQACPFVLISIPFSPIQANASQLPFFHIYFLELAFVK